MRRCGWFSAEELAQCIPKNSITEQNISWQTAFARARTHVPYLNVYFRKYMGSSRKRHSHALSQIYTETGIFKDMKEIGSGARKPYAAFYGRGYNQLTWPENYLAYGKFRCLADQKNPVYFDSRINATSVHADAGGKSFKWSPKFDPDIVANDLSHSAEASGFYWIGKHFRGTSNINRVCDLEYNPLTVAFACWLINGGGHGHDSRQQAAKFIANVLFDERPIVNIVKFSYPPLKPSAKIPLCQTFPPTAVNFSETTTVNYEKQIP
jgi:predicted chitinase